MKREHRNPPGEQLLEAEIVKIAYSNDEGSFCVAQAAPKQGGGMVTVVGDLCGAHPGEALIMSGRWMHHPKFGRQFSLSCVIKSESPTTTTGIRRYLSSGQVAGIGKVMAKRIIDKFGTQTLDVIDSQIERLKEVEGIGTKRIAAIAKAWKEDRNVRTILVFLQGHGVGRMQARKIHRHYGEDAIATVKNNPYRLASEIKGIGFKTADEIAQKVGIEKTSPFRLEAGVLHVLLAMTEEGHTCLPWDELITRAQLLLGVEREDALRGAAIAYEKKRIRTEDLNDTFDNFQANDKLVFPPALYASEEGIARLVEGLASGPAPDWPESEVEKTIQTLEASRGIVFSDEQRTAVKALCRTGFLIITGGPGTGKTTVTSALVALAGSRNASLLLAAPTGRAARRLAETTGCPAKTIHRALEFQPHLMRFARARENPLDAEMVVVDEASMIDTFLMYSLLKAVPATSKIVLIGDADQLPSVGPGNVLQDLIESGAVRAIRLTNIFRQDQQGLIVRNAHRVLNGRTLVLPDRGHQAASDFFRFQVNSPARAAEEIVALVRDKLPERFGLDPLRDIQCICPMYKGEAGAENLNRLLQETLNPDGAPIDLPGTEFKVGDKVMQTRNNYTHEVFNGDIGYIQSVNPSSAQVIVRFDEADVPYDQSTLDELMLAYAISVHKSQGSEYPAVIMPILTQHFKLLQRNLLYTAITRAKRLLVLVGTDKAITIAINNNEVRKRHTGLKRRLAQEKP